MSAKLFYAVSILLGVAVAGCTPANHVRNVRQEPLKCEVRICTNLNTGLARCDCRSSEQAERQLREASWLSAE
jgi:hypothetical protein